MQATDICRRDVHTYSQFNFYRSAEGQSWEDHVPRIYAHTDESLITLLLTSPGEPRERSASGALDISVVAQLRYLGQDISSACLHNCHSAASLVLICFSYVSMVLPTCYVQPYLHPPRIPHVSIKHRQLTALLCIDSHVQTYARHFEACTLGMLNASLYTAHLLE